MLKRSNHIDRWFTHVCRTRYQGFPGRLRLWNGWQTEFSAEPRFTLTVVKPAGLLALLRPDLGGLARAYVEGQIDFDGSPWAVIRSIDEWSSSRAARPAKAWRARPRDRSTDGKAVRSHYDVSNEFFKTFLDWQMVYSCAYFRQKDFTLDAAQEQKLDLICRKLILTPHDRFLDIGCGWGALIRWAAKYYDVKATGITISRNQYQYACQRIREEGLEDRCKVLLLDYRDFSPRERFDKIASVGMFEHVGLAQMDHYFGKIKDLLVEGGLVLNHGICSTTLDQREVGGSVGSFIEKYVFPYSELPHLSFVERSMASQGFEVTDVESLRPHYARTLKHWFERLEENAQTAKQIAGEKRYRVWRAYLAGCSYAFERGWISIYQVLASRESRSGRWVLPQTREHLYRERALAASA